MSTYTQILYQLVFSTKHREPTLVKEHKQQLFQYIWGLLKEKKCHLYQINCVEDHLHILTHLHPSIALANLVKDIKLGASDFIKREQIFPDFMGWQYGYGVFTYSINEKNKLMEYIKNQEEHHKQIDFKNEFIVLLKENGVEFDEKYLV